MIKKYLTKLSIVFIAISVLFLFVVSTFDFSTKKVSAGSVSISTYSANHLAGGITTGASGGSLGAFGSSYVTDGIRCVVPGLSNLSDAYKANVWQYGINILNNATTLEMGSMYNYGRVSVEFSIGYFDSSTGNEISNSNSQDLDNKNRYPVDIRIVERKTDLAQDDNVLAVLRIWTKTDKRGQLSGLNDYSLYMIEDDSSWTEYVGTGVAINGNATLDSSFYIEFNNVDLFSARCNAEGVIEKLDGINPETGDAFSDVFIEKYAQDYDTVFLQINGDDGFIHETEILVRSMNGQSLKNNGTSFTDTLAPLIRQPKVDDTGDITLSEYTVGSTQTIPNVYWATDFFGGVSYETSVKGSDETSERSFTVPATEGYFTVDFIARDRAGNESKREFTFYAKAADKAITTEYANRVYLNPKNNNWTQSNARFAAYFYGSSGEKWVSMSNTGSQIYSADIPSGSWTHVIFCRMNGDTKANNWENKWNQTSDLSLSGNQGKMYTVKLNTWDKGGGTWSNVDSTYSVEEIHFIPDQNWKADGARFALYFYSSSNNDYGFFNASDSDGDGIYTAKVEKKSLNYYNKIIFVRMNGGSGKEDNNWDNKWDESGKFDFSYSTANCFVMPNTTGYNSWTGWTTGFWTSLTNITYYYTSTVAAATAKIVYPSGASSNTVSMTKTNLEYIGNDDNKTKYNVFQITSLLPSDGNITVTFDTNISSGSKTAATINKKLYNGSAWCSMVTTEFKGNYVGCANEIVSRFEGSRIEHSIPEREGWVFNGWYSDKTCPDHLSVSSTLAIDGQYYGSWGTNFNVGTEFYFQASALWSSVNNNNPYIYAYFYNYQGDAQWVETTKYNEISNLQNTYKLTIPDGEWSNVIFISRKSAYANIGSVTTKAPFDDKEYQSINIRPNVYSNICIIEPILVDAVEQEKNAENAYYALWHVMTTFNFIGNKEAVIADRNDSISTQVESFDLDRAGYTLGGWSVDNPDEVQDVTAVTLTETSNLISNGLIYYAYWYVTTTLVYTNANNVDSNIEISTFEGIDIRTIVDYVVPTRDNFTFAGWGESALITDYNDILTDAVPAISGTYYANWEVTATFIANYSTIDNGLSNDTIEITALENSLVDLPMTEFVIGYQMTGWYSAQNGGNRLNGTSMTANGNTYYAQWIEAPLFANIDLMMYYYYPTSISNGNLDVSETPNILYIGLKAYANIYDTIYRIFIDESYTYTLCLYVNGSLDTYVTGVYQDGVITFEEIIIEKIDASKYKSNEYSACVIIKKDLNIIHQDVLINWTTEDLVDEYVIDYNENNYREISEHQYLIMCVAHNDNNISGHKYDTNQFGTDYVFDENYHYKACAVCNEENAREEHNFNGEYVYDPTSHWVECEDCGYRKQTDHQTYDDEIESAARKVTGSVATCLNPATYYYTCSLGHDYNVSYSWSGTEDNPSLTVTINCSRCNLDDKTLTFTKSNGLTQTAYTAATCTTAGSRTFSISSSYTYYDDAGVARTVNYSNQKTYTIAALGHNYEFDSFVWTDYTADAKLVCTHDNSHIDYVDATVTSIDSPAATCTTTGTRIYTATYGGNTATKNQTIPINSNNHNYVSGYWDGVYNVSICSRCNKVLQGTKGTQNTNDSALRQTVATNVAANMIHTVSFKGTISAPLNSTITLESNKYPQVGTKIEFSSGAKSGDYIYVHIDWMYHTSSSRAKEANAVRITGSINGNAINVTYWLDGCGITLKAGGQLIVTRFNNTIKVQVKNSSGSLVKLYDNNGSNPATSKTYTISHYQSATSGINGGNSATNGKTDIYDGYSVILLGKYDTYTGTTSSFALDGNVLGTYGSTTRENYDLFNGLPAGTNYTLEFDYKGTRRGIGYSNVMKFGVHMWYVDGNNYLETYVYWDPGTNRRSHQIYEIQMTGKINGTAVKWNSFWGDASSSGTWGSGSSYTCYPADGGHMKIVKNGTSFTFTLKTNTVYQKTGTVNFGSIQNQAENGTLSMNNSVAYNVIIYADGDEFTISNIKYS